MNVGEAPSPPPPSPSPPLEQVTDPARAVAMVQGATRRERIIEGLWLRLGQPMMRMTFHNWYGLRRVLLRLFGARVHPTARIRPSARISHPWNLTIGAHSAIGDHAILFCLGPVSIGKRCTISQYSHLCAAGHDHTRREMPLIMKPICIEDDVWIAADVFVGPGVVVGTDTVVGARSTVLRSLPPRTICTGDNAKPIGKRIIRWPPAAAGVAPS